MWHARESESSILGRPGPQVGVLVGVQVLNAFVIGSVYKWVDAVVKSLARQTLPS